MVSQMDSSGIRRVVWTVTAGQNLWARGKMVARGPYLAAILFCYLSAGLFSQTTLISNMAQNMEMPRAVVLVREA